MDTAKAITHIGLCAGYGGIELGLKRVLPTLRSVALCEIEAFAIANLVAKMEAGLMDAAPIWTDLKTLPWAEFRDRVDILTGGYPCQPFSAAGKRKGKDDSRHLWPWIANGIELLRPRVCFFENVEGHISLGLSTVISDLEELGYAVAWGIFSAAEVGAPHQRKRVFVLANRNEQGLEGWVGRIMRECTCELPSGPGSAWPSRPGEPQHEWEPPRVLADSHGQHGSAPTEGWEHDAETGHASQSVGNAESGTRFWEAQREAGHATQSDESVGNTSGPRCSKTEDARANRSDEGEWAWREELKRASGIVGNSTDARQQKRRSGSVGRCAAESESERSDCESYNAECKAQPPMGGDADGTAGRLDDAELCVSCDNRTDELRLLGNGVVPATAERAFRVLWEKLSV